MGFKVKDHFFNKAKKENYLARSIYKLEEIDQKFAVFKPGQKVLDIGYYPGSWIQFIKQRVGAGGQIRGIDIQEINAKLVGDANIKLYRQDFTQVESIQFFEIEDFFDVVCSDMAPSTTGIKTVDQLRSLSLVEDVFAKLPKFLKEGGHLVAKIFESQEARDFLRAQKASFTKLATFKPKATRSISKEFFIIGLGYHV